MTRNVTITTYSFDEGTAVIEFNTSVRGYVKNSSSSVRLYLDGEGHEQTLFSLESSGGSTQTSWQHVIEDVSSFRGETVGLRAEIVGGGELQLAYSNVRQNYDGDRFWDRTENLGIPVNGGERTEPLSATRADTDGDGIPDGKEVGAFINYTTDGKEYYVLRSDPLRADSDGDRLSDYEEKHVWDTAIRREDTDLDGYSDFVDPNLHSEDASPPIYNVTSKEFNGYVRVRLPDSVDAADIVLDATYNHQGRSYSTTNHDVRKLGDATVGTWWRVDIRYRSGYGGHPDYYWLNVTDDSDDTTNVLIEPNQGSAEATFKAASVGFVAAPASGYGRTAYESSKILLRVSGSAARFASVAGPVAVGVTASYAGAWATGQFYAEVIQAETAKTTSYDLAAVPMTAIAAEYAADETHPDIGRVVLYAGAVAEVSFNGKTYSRGYGERFISRISSISHQSLETVVTSSSSTVYGNSERRIVIGDGVERELILTIIGVTLTTAGQEATDPCNNNIKIPTYSENTHPYKNGDTLEDLKKAIEGPWKDKVFTDGVRLYIIASTGSGYFILKMTPYGNPWVLSTMLLKNSESLWQTGKDAYEYLKNDYRKDRTIREYGTEPGEDC